MSAWDQIYAHWTETMPTAVALSQIAAFCAFALLGAWLGWVAKTYWAAVKARKEPKKTGKHRAKPVRS